MANRFSVFNGDFPAPECTNKFTLSAKPNTDLWRSPSRDVFTAPIIYLKERLSTFRRARVTVEVPGTRLYDQGGLVFILPGSPQRWLKAGIEYVDGIPKVGAVVVDRYSDWSLVELQNSEKGLITVEFEREGQGLWVYAIEKDGKRQAIREITWVFSEGLDNQELWIGLYAARPNADASEPLVVKFEDFVLEKE
ncbi:hypothetical protein GLOTRDRAFT_65718 [Gloeophyllum trabeum ATCC 11539]|uniref:DUF1349-domain-containing protein n=1 Tax=Gloeophyllum trabeum (strain ATCC 11539 / FP-39264 / Madison 617) TaxID=670483 RepID=S7PW49_GLOTA|nr:uncharacterized protein GLOTRDRAFT_65718 [Gloeophyllum trabeum ATCC 11539]EPQ51537.1 hypothetical protein GLOTRDRAFT_65718 [Gloeophyllum trabeum ATCC 11539]